VLDTPKIYLRAYPIAEGMGAHAAAVEEDGCDGLLFTDTQNLSMDASGSRSLPGDPAAASRSTNRGNFGCTAFYEVRMYPIPGSPMLGVLRFVGHDGSLQKLRGS
jgi:hypothetical protein